MPIFSKVMMNKLEQLVQISNVFSNENTDYVELLNATKAYRDLLVSICDLDLNQAKNRKNIELGHGMALGTAWAAMCINDIVRTKRFIKGTLDAVQFLIDQKDPSRKEPIQVLYAGTGPFATLILPLMCKYSKDEIQFTLLEINEETTIYLKKVIQIFNFEEYIREIHCTDACTFEIPKDLDVDLIVSETMQYALYRELQVPIMVNLLKQAKKEVLIIPEEIIVELGYWNTSCSDKIAVKHQKLTEVLRYNKTEIHQWIEDSGGFLGDIRFSKTRVSIDPEDLRSFDKIAYYTEIKIFGDEIIRLNESGLTIPKPIPKLYDQITEKTMLEIEYKLKPIPQLVHEFQTN